MDISPQAIASASFPVVKKGFDPDHVRSFLSEVGRALESAQNQSTAMEARARAAVAKLQELTQATAQAPADAAAMSSGDAEAISRTLLLAQKAADSTIAEARQEADTMVSAARAEAATVVGDARRQAAQQIEDARAEARRTLEADKQRVESEVQALLARREFLLSDVEHLDEFVATQRRRVQDVAALLNEVADRGPGGLGDARRPLLSAAADGAGASAAAGSDLYDAEPATNDVVFVSEPETVPDGLLGDWGTSSTDAASSDVSSSDETTLITDAFVQDADSFSDWNDSATLDSAPVETAPAVEEQADPWSPFDDADEAIETTPTPTQSPALLDFDDLDDTAEIPAQRPSGDGSH